MSGQQTWEDKIRQRFPEYGGEETDFFKKWVYTGHFKDHGTPAAVCELCGNRGLRYHYLIAHRQTGEGIWVGSQCVLNFEAGQGAHRQRLRVQKERRQAHRESAHHERIAGLIEQLQLAYRLAGEGEKRKMRWLVGVFQRRGAFAPGEAAWLLQLLLVCGVQPEPLFFPLSLRTKKEKAELKTLSITEMKLISACLTDEQKALCRQMGLKWVA